MRWHALALYLALLPTRWIGQFLATRTPLPTELVGAAVWASLVTGIFVLASPTSQAVRFGPLTPAKVGLGLAAGLVLFLGGAAGYMASERILGLTRSTSVSTFGTIGGALELGVVAVALLAVVVAEETAFRGILLETLRQETGAVTATAASAAAFALYHLSAYQALSTLLYGLALAAVTLWTGGLWTAVVAHLTLNGLGVVLSALTAGGAAGP